MVDLTQMTYDFGPPPTTDSWRTSSAGEISWHFLSVCPSLPLSVEVPGLWHGNGSGNLHQIFRVDRPTRWTRALHFSRVRDERGTWHVPLRKGLHKFVQASAGQTRDTADSKLAVHMYEGRSKSSRPDHEGT